jgi:hypothetical protein
MASKIPAITPHEVVAAPGLYVYSLEAYGTIRARRFRSKFFSLGSKQNAHIFPVSNENENSRRTLNTVTVNASIV